MLKTRLEVVRAFRPVSGESKWMALATEYLVATWYGLGFPFFVLSHSGAEARLFPYSAAAALKRRTTRTNLSPRRFPRGPQRNSQRLALLIKMAALQAERLGRIGDVMMLAVQLCQDRFPLELHDLLGKQAVMIA